eukprot:scaffold114790_cov15-Tisochrysis_lutea.AAC.1
MNTHGGAWQRSLPRSPKKQLEASKQQQRDFCHHLLRASAQVTLYTILLGVDGVIYAPTHFRAF